MYAGEKERMYVIPIKKLTKRELSVAGSGRVPALTAIPKEIFSL
jgi:hypothetical protein